MRVPLADRVRPILDTARSHVPGTHRVESDRVHLDAAIGWLRHSQAVTGTGGSAATYNLLLGWEEPYPETSGYIVPTLFAYADVHDDDAVRQRAIEMAEWTRSTQRSDGSFPGGTGGDGDPNAFNTGQILLGLAAAFERTGAARYRAALRDACEWLVDTQSEAGHWAAYDYNTRPHAYTTRVAWPLLVAAAVLDGDIEPYREAARRNLRWVLDAQRPNGWFPNAGFDSGDDPFLHTIAYTIRGLIEAGTLLGDDDAVAGGRRAADRLLDVQRTTGVLRGAYDASWSPSWYACPTGNAQMAVVWTRLYDLTGDEEYRIAARTSVQFLTRHQPLSGADAVRGGVPGSYPIVGRYLPLRYPNWGAKFLADALLRLRAVRNGGAFDPGSDTAGTDRDGLGIGTGPGERSATSADGDGSDPVRVCLLVDGEHVFRWVATAIERLLATTDAEISLVVSNQDAGVLGTDTVERGRRYPAYAAFWLVSKGLSGLADGPRYDDTVHLSELPGVADAPRVRTYPDAVEGLWSELPPEVVDRIGATSDLVLRRGFGLLRGDVLTATDHGVLSYHHGDPRAYRGGPAGFWEFLHGESTAGVMVQRLRPELDAGDVLAYADVDISGCRSWGAVRRALYGNSADLLAEAVETARSDDADPLDLGDPGPVYHPPSAPDLARYLATAAERRL
jgi:hypothetical protein